jgi:hypothetical protein
MSPTVGDELRRRIQADVDAPAFKRGVSPGTQEHSSPEACGRGLIGYTSVHSFELWIRKGIKTLLDGRPKAYGSGYLWFGVSFLLSILRTAC